ncbi:hypothetical protein A1O1_00134 [Capronia coronata CBS 617.96]|uniref:Uncharacterized protein n=1 Tax=Capronia coronata CBS 617.96 TaxID=1182541 RepID=W9Z0C6_9EURO|nr:uncharacterized protein A1O1_00134 [Capronia coronata CBS 617.96]EXJ95016.1 hypothetical protein A1O1_00134 [Capronia coronata CBS 617.96]
MVNIAKRMRSFQPLWRIRNGQGAAILPPPPSPQLTHLLLRFPRGEWRKPVHGPRLFANEHLPRLKYHNPALPIRVETFTKSQLQVTFESSDRGSLEALESRNTEADSEGEKLNEEWSTIESKPQPAADPSTPSSTSPPSEIFVRRATVDIAGKRPRQIWHWLKSAAKCEDIAQSPEDVELMRRLNAFFQKADIDRKRVKAGIDEMRKQKEDLRKAREAAERLTSES